MTAKSRTQACDHAKAVKRLSDARTIVHPDAGTAAASLGRLIDLKDASHYGFTTVSAAKRNGALKSARQVVAFAEGVVEA